MASGNKRKTDLEKYFKEIKEETIEKVIESLEEVLEEIKEKTNLDVPLILANKFHDKKVEIDVMDIIKRVKKSKEKR